MTRSSIPEIAAEMVRDQEKRPGIAEILTIIDALGVTQILGVAATGDLVVMLYMQKEQKWQSTSPIQHVTEEVRKMYELAKSAPSHEIVRVRERRPKTEVFRREPWNAKDAAKSKPLTVTLGAMIGQKEREKK